MSKTTTKTKRKLFKKLSLVLVMALGCSVCWADYNVPSSGTWSGGTVTSNQMVYLADNVTITGPITIDGCKLTIKPNGEARKITNTSNGNLGGMFILKNGATLYIGSDDIYNKVCEQLSKTGEAMIPAFDNSTCCRMNTLLEYIIN